MSKQKSPETIQREKDREIRRERRELKATAKAERKARREAKAALREKFERGERVIIKTAQKEQDDFSWHEAMRYDPLAFCGRCRTFRRSSEMIDDSICERCYYSEQAGEGAKANPQDPAGDVKAGQMTLGI